MKYRGLFTSCIIAIIIVLTCFGCGRTNAHKLVLPTDLNEVHVKTDVRMKAVLTKKTKVVAFFRGKYANEKTLPLYSKFVNKYPNVGFMFYINYLDKKGIIENLESHGISYPFYFDPDNVFLKSNNPYIRQDLTFMGFIVNSKNEVKHVTNPSFQDFEKRLMEE